MMNFLLVVIWQRSMNGFIECLYKYIIKYITDNFRNIKIYGSTLLSDNSSIPKWKLKTKIFKNILI